MDFQLILMLTELTFFLSLPLNIEVSMKQLWSASAIINLAAGRLESHFEEDFLSRGFFTATCNTT